ncbi:hypothetical protein UlMin_034033 [Ulmus minor]
MSLIEPDNDTVRSMAIGAIFPDFGGKINSIDFHWKDDILVTASDDDLVRLYDIANAKLLKTTYHKKHGADRICFTHHPSSVICSSKYNLDSTGESLWYLSMYDNRCLRYFKGHKDRIVSFCMSLVNDCFMSSSLDHSVRIWNFRVNACQPKNYFQKHAGVTIFSYANFSLVDICTSLGVLFACSLYMYVILLYITRLKCTNSEIYNINMNMKTKVGKKVKIGNTKEPKSSGEIGGTAQIGGGSTRKEVPSSSCLQTPPRHRLPIMVTSSFVP